MQLLSSTNPALREPAIKFDFTTENSKVLLESLVDQFSSYLSFVDINGITAKHLGVNFSIFEFRRSNLETTLCINPEILAIEAVSPTVSIEKCNLLFPYETFKIKRPTNIVVSYKNINNQEITENLTDFDAIHFLQCYDVLNGILLSDRVSKLSRNIMHRKVLKKIKKGKLTINHD